MYSRRQIAGAMNGGGIASPLLAESQTPLGSMNLGNYHQATLKLLARTERVAVPSFRFGIVMRSGIKASGNSGSSSTEAVAELVGVDIPMLQK